MATDSNKYVENNSNRNFSKEFKEIVIGASRQLRNFSVVLWQVQFNAIVKMAALY